jgi:type IV secretory pathway VirB4 component
MKAGQKMIYGMNGLSRNLILLDRFTLLTPSGLILGAPGSGKSFAAKREMINVLLNDPTAEVLIIDPEREYTPLAKGFDGEIVHICAESKNHINPMDCSMYYSEFEDDPLSIKSEFILAIFDLLVGGRNGLDGSRRTIIYRACDQCYAKYFSNPSKFPMPTLKDLFNTIKNQPDPEAGALAQELEIYIGGAPSIFAHHTNVDNGKRLVIYDVYDLGKQLRTFGMLVALDQIWNRITQNYMRENKRTWIYIDEVQHLFSNAYGAQYFYELWKLARRWGMALTGIAQSIEKILLSDLLDACSFVMMFNQTASDRAKLAKLFDLSDEQLEFVTNSDPDHGLLFTGKAGKSIVPFINNFPVDTILYRMMTNKIGTSDF